MFIRYLIPNTDLQAASFIFSRELQEFLRNDQIIHYLQKQNYWKGGNLFTSKEWVHLVPSGSSSAPKSNKVDVSCAYSKNDQQVTAVEGIFITLFHHLLQGEKSWHGSCAASRRSSSTCEGRQQVLFPHLPAPPQHPQPFTTLLVNLNSKSWQLIFIQNHAHSP